MSISHLIIRLRHQGIRWFATTVFNRIWPARPAQASAVLAAVKQRGGLEIGGPSPVFFAKGILPVYLNAGQIDNVNFASQTAWEAGLRDEGVFTFNSSKPPGRQLLREATNLHGIPDCTYDFVLSSHCLEHVANPLAALREWLRVVRPGGHLILLLPDPVRTFDHRRPVTSLAHLQADYNRGASEDDLTHLDEILALHDLHRDPHAGTPEAFEARSRLNSKNRCLHHHVFDLTLQRAVLEEAGWIVRETERVRPLHLVALARRPFAEERSSAAVCFASHTISPSS